jgi:hypothetical protein
MPKQLERCLDHFSFSAFVSSFVFSLFRIRFHSPASYFFILQSTQRCINLNQKCVLMRTISPCDRTRRKITFHISLSYLVRFRRH